MVETQSAPRAVPAEGNLCKRAKGYREDHSRRGDAAEREQPAEILRAWGAIRKRIEAIPQAITGYRAVPIKLQKPSRL